MRQHAANQPNDGVLLRAREGARKRDGVVTVSSNVLFGHPLSMLGLGRLGTVPRPWGGGQPRRTVARDRCVIAARLTTSPQPLGQSRCAVARAR